MRRLVSIPMLAVLTLMCVWSVIAVRVVHVQHFCSNAIQWRIVFQPPDQRNLTLAPGIYRASSYTLANGFGVGGITQTFVVVPLDSSR